MQQRSRTWRSIGVPVALVGLAVVMPVEGLAPATAAQQWADRAACQADGLGSQVTQAAREFCGSGSAAAIVPPPVVLPLLLPAAECASFDALDHRAHLLPIDPHVIDLPPPC